MNEEYYRKIPVSTPPEKGGLYLMCNEKLEKISDAQWGLWQELDTGMHLASSMPYVFPFWLKPTSSEELALINPTEYRRGFVEGEQSQMRKALLFAEFLNRTCVSDHIGRWQIVDGTKEYFTTPELYNSNDFQQYLKEKGV